jgi:hypothetical protein
LAWALAVIAAAGLAGCGAPPELKSRGPDVPEPSARPPLRTTAAPPGYTPRPTPPVSFAPTPFPEYVAVDCAGRPTPEQVIAVVRRDTDIDPGGVITSPLCAGTWQYTLLSVPGREPVKVLTRSVAGGFELVAAGTDVCSLDIQHQAPSGVYTAASC